MKIKCKEKVKEKGNGERCVICGATAQWGLLCRKHYHYYDFKGERLKREVEKEHKWKKEIRK